ncbi:MAG: M14 family zinc carboxypeptidase, partial [Candidatus Krumholzibacteriota bacterium]
IAGILEKDYGTLSVPYGRFADPAEPEKGWRTYNENIRYLTNYVGLRNRFAILNENYVYADYRTRVYGCYNFLLAIARYTASHLEKMKSLAAEADRWAVERWRETSPRDSFVVEMEVQPLERKVLIRGYEMEVISRERGWPRVRKKQKEVDYRIPYLADFVPSKRAGFPYAYLMPYPDPDIIDVILSHGIVLERLTTPAELEVEVFRTSEINRADYLYQGHYLTSLKGDFERVKKNFPAGTLFITTAQPLGNLAAQLLEPQSGDGLVTWNFFDRYLVSQWRRDLLPYPVSRLPEPANLEKARITTAD